MKSNSSIFQPTQKSWLAKVLSSPTKLGFGLALAAMALILPACDNSNQQATSEQPQTEADAGSTTDPEQLVGQTVVVNGEVDEVYSPNAFSMNADDTFGAGEKVLVLVSSTSAAGAGTGTGTGGSAAGTGSTGTSTGTADPGAASTDTGTSTGTSGTGATTGTGTGTNSPGATTGTGTAGTGATAGTGTGASTADLTEGETVQLTGEVQRFTPETLQSEYGITLDETLLSQLRQDYDGQPVIVTSSFDQLPAGTSNSAPTTPTSPSAP
ncbi:MAG TPA: hypothetical protein V6D29_02030 [Leptolyngbyaceae cyanobacterium]